MDKKIRDAYTTMMNSIPEKLNAMMQDAMEEKYEQQEQMRKEEKDDASDN